MPYAISLNGVDHLSVSELRAGTGHNDILFYEESAPTTDEWPQGASYFYRDNVSIRKLKANLSEGTFEVKLFTGACPEDFELAVGIVNFIATLVGSDEIHSDGFDTYLTAEEFRQSHDARWAQQQSYDQLAELILKYTDMRAEAAGRAQAVMTIEGIKHSLVVGRRVLDPLLEDPRTLPEKLFAKLRRLNYFEKEAGGFVASFLNISFTLVGEEERKHSGQVYITHSNTLLCSEVDEITLSSRLEESTQAAVSLEPLKLIELLDGREEWLDDRYFVAPVLTQEEFWELRGKAEAFDISKKGIGPGRGAVTQEGQEAASASLLDQFTKEEAASVLLSPLCVFALVAAADGKVDEKELNSFTTALTTALDDENELMRIAIGGTIAALQQHGFEACHFVDPFDALSTAAAAADRRLDVDSAEDFRQGLIELGLVIAQSSGSIFRKVGKEEQQILRRIAALLRVPLPQR